MKKNIILVMFYLLAFAAVAQTSTDTISGRWPHYYYTYAFEDDMPDMPWGSTSAPAAIFVPRDSVQNVGDFGDRCFPVNIASKEIARLIQCDSSMHVVGIAFLPDWHFYYNGYSGVMLEECDLTATVYDTGMVVLKMNTISGEALAKGPTWKPVGKGVFGTFLELYFNDTLLIDKPLYISVTARNYEILMDSPLLYVVGDGFRHDYECHFPYEQRRYRTSEGDGWHDEICGYNHMTMSFPILAMKCYDVENLRYEPVGSAGTMAYVQWGLDILHDYYEVSYGPVGTPPGDGTVIQTHQPRVVINQLDRNTRYDVYVRAHCDRDTSGWSSWSDTLHVHLATYGIDNVGDDILSLSPNPARGTATVRCEAGVQSVEVVSATGATVLSLDGGGAQACVLDLAGLAKGVYVVRIATPQGTAAQKLAVE